MSILFGNITVYFMTERYSWIIIYAHFLFPEPFDSCFVSRPFHGLKLSSQLKVKWENLAQPASVLKHLTMKNQYRSINGDIHNTPTKCNLNIDVDIIHSKTKKCRFSYQHFPLWSSKCKKCNDERVSFFFFIIKDYLIWLHNANETHLGHPILKTQRKWVWLSVRCQADRVEVNNFSFILK